MNFVCSFFTFLILIPALADLPDNKVTSAIPGGTRFYLVKPIIIEPRSMNKVFERPLSNGQSCYFKLDEEKYGPSYYLFDQRKIIPGDSKFVIYNAERPLGKIWLMEKAKYDALKASGKSFLQFRPEFYIYCDSPLVDIGDLRQVLTPYGEFLPTEAKILNFY